MIFLRCDKEECKYNYYNADADDTFCGLTYGSIVNGKCKDFKEESEEDEE